MAFTMRPLESQYIGYWLLVTCSLGSDLPDKVINIKPRNKAADYSCMVVAS